MVEFEKFKLDNGLVFIIHQDKSTPMAAVNLLYNVGARDESPDRTGFAHLFEHLMFSGSSNVPDFDAYLQNAGGDSNAFTNSDITNFYETVPADNLETALWLEADRMSTLNINKKSLDVQRKVVVEEFNETCLNMPYGDAWHRISKMAFEKHPYRWPTIGLEPKHIQEASLKDVRHFYKKYYAPNNAILVIGGNIDIQQTKDWVKTYFGHIPATEDYHRKLPQEPRQSVIKREVTKANVPLDAIYLVFHAVARSHEDHHSVDLLSDVLCNGKSSRLYKKVKKQLKLFIDIDAYVTGNFDPGLLVIEGRLSEGVDPKVAEQAIWDIIDEIKLGTVTESELLKYKNKAISGLVFNECNLLNRTMNLAFFETIGDAALINEEEAAYQKVQVDDIHRVANEYLSPENCSILLYEKEAVAAE